MSSSSGTSAKNRRTTNAPIRLPVSLLDVDALEVGAAVTDRRVQLAAHAVLAVRDHRLLEHERDLVALLHDDLRRLLHRTGRHRRVVDRRTGPRYEVLDLRPDRSELVGEEPGARVVALEVVPRGGTVRERDDQRG